MKLREPKWHGGQKLWVLRIGHKLNKKGQPVEASFYWPAPAGDRAPAAVIAEAVKKQEDYEHIKINWSDYRHSLPVQTHLKACPITGGPMSDGFTFLGKRYDKFPDLSKPVWFDFKKFEEDCRIGKANRQARDMQSEEYVARDKEQQFIESAKAKPAEDLNEVLKRLVAAGIVPADLVKNKPSRTVTLREAIEEFMQHEEARTKLKIGKNITVNTYNGTRSNLLAVFGITTATDSSRIKVNRTVTDLTKPLVEVNRDVIKAIADYWCSMPEGVSSSRTVKNYLATLKHFMNWCAKQQAFGWTKPKDMDDVLTIRDVDKKTIAAYDKDRLKPLMDAAGNRSKMYAIFGLLLGYYPADVASTKANEFFIQDGEWYIKRERSKEKGGKKSGRIILTKHWVAPELVKLIQRYHVPNNPYGLLLLNKNGLPMLREKVKGTKHSAAAKAWESHCRRQSVSYQFKQLRKHGWNAVKLHTGSVEMAERWSGQSKGVSDHYDDSIYLPTIEAQKKWAQQLREDGII